MQPRERDSSVWVGDSAACAVDMPSRAVDSPVWVGDSPCGDVGMGRWVCDSFVWVGDSPAQVGEMPFCAVDSPTG
ncbi:MAG TPA: hypothetical protein VGL80_20520, partial [Pseudonocardiaceae bacterium]